MYSTVINLFKSEVVEFFLVSIEHLKTKICELKPKKNL